MAASKEKKINVGFIGVGGRSWALIESVNRIRDAEVTAICDIRPERLEEKREMFRKAGMKQPAACTDFRELLADPLLDAVIVPSSWNLHIPAAIASMKAGKRVAIEVGGAASLDQLWQFVRTFEETGVPCMMLENCCYDRNELMVLNMIRQGLFGELIHCECGYEHSLPVIACQAEAGFDRTFHNARRNGDLYPTHGIGPIAKMLNINRGNRFLTLTSTASKARGFAAYAASRNYQGAGPFRQFNKGDVVTTVVKCANGETVTIVHNISLPRPYSRHCRVEGTEGIWLEDAGGIYIEKFDGVPKKNELGVEYVERKWKKIEDYRKKYDHPLWKRANGRIQGGHGGMDTLCIQAFIHSVRTKTPPPIDVYDTAAWMSITCLSEDSIAMGSAPVAIPDFTNGKWIDREPEAESPWMLGV